MSTTCDDLEKRLQKRAQEAVEKLLEQKAGRRDMSMSEMEDLVGDFEIAIRQSLLQEMVADAQTTQQGLGEACGGKLRYKGKKTKHVVTVRGEVVVERDYYQCERCGTAIFPLDKQLGLNTTAYSQQLAHKMVWLSGLWPYEQCSAVFKEIGERFIPASSIWRQTQYQGERLHVHVKQQQQQVSVERVVLPDARHDHDQGKAVSVDGGMVNIRGAGWRELKVGAVFDVETRLQRNPQTHQLDEMAHGVNVHYTAGLGAKRDFTPALWALAVRHQLPTAKERAGIGDGAAWVWNGAEDVCPDGRQIVDWFHAVQPLAQAANTLYPDERDAKKRQRWLKTYQDHLDMGRIHKITAALVKAGRPDLAGYFETHQRRMQYLEFREERWPIGSGVIESGVKQFKQRLTGPGMRWNADNANRLLVVRAAVLGNDFHDLWQMAA